VRFCAKGFTLTQEDYVVDGPQARCSRCDFKCVHPGTMERHVNEFHKKVMPYKCRCGRPFWARNALMQHEGRFHRFRDSVLNVKNNEEQEEEVEGTPQRKRRVGDFFFLLENMKLEGSNRSMPHERQIS
jgi:hypothetical protein